MKVIAVKVAARLGMQTRKAATERRATTGEMASAKAAAHAGAAAEPAAHMTAAEPAAHMTATAEPAPMSTSTSTSPAATRKRVGGQPPVRAAVVNNTIMVLRNMGILLRTRPASIRLKTQSGHCSL
jgi:hypothetical protein